MKRILRHLLLPILVLTLCFASGIGVQAAKKLTATYKGNTISLVGTSTTFSKVKKAWGTPNKTQNVSGGKVRSGKLYTYKKGKSYIAVLDSKSLTKLYYEVNIKDKNMYVNDVKVGMKKATAISKLQKAYGKSKVKDNKKGTITVYYTGINPIKLSYKSGKITTIYVMTMS